ncbi:MAG: cytochrome P450 [Natronomonas sp.]
MTDRAPSEPPGPDGLPVLGNSLQFFRNPTSFPERCIREYGDIVSVRVAGTPTFLLGHPDHVKHVLADNFEHYEKGELYRDELSFLGDGLLVSDGDHWARQRKLIAPMFHPDRIERYAHIMVKYAVRAVDDLSPNEPVDVDERMQGLALEVISKALMDVDVGMSSPAIRRALADVMDGARASSRIPLSFPEWVPTPGNVRYNRAMDTFDTIVADIIREHRENPDGQDTVISKLVAASESEGRSLTDRQIRNEITTLLLAGHDTTALGLSYTLSLLAEHPDEQNRVIDEIDRVVGEETPKPKHVGELEWTESAIKESLRLFPPSYLFVRDAIDDDEIGGYRIPAGSMLVLHPWSIHRDGRFFDGPERFDPGRWTDGLEADLHPFAYFPFSGGPRRCVGEHFAWMEMQLVLVTLLQTYRFDLAFEPPIELRPRITLRPAHSISLIPRPR